MKAFPSHWQQPFRLALLLCLAAALPPSVLATDRYAVTHNAYSDQDDLEAAVRNEYGAHAFMADWEEIKAGYLMTKSPDATVLFHGRLSDTNLIETLAHAKRVQLPAGAMNAVAGALGQQLGSSSCLVLQSRNVETQLPVLATGSLVVFWGRDVNFDQATDLKPASAALLGVDRANNLVLIERVKDRQLQFRVPIIQVTR